MIPSPIASTIVTISLISATVNGCQSLPDPDSVQKAMCEQIEPIYYSGSEDTAATIEQVQAHNRVYAALCRGE